jgi:2-polyprenyl-3-methyl-5-hydroxy-6-metoxy-1,4-benzoquinol methylase
MAMQVEQRHDPRVDSGYVNLQETPYRGHWLVERAVLRHTSVGDRIFDAGVSTGYLAQRFLQAGRRVDGADIDPAAAQAAMQLCEQVWVGDLQHFAVEQMEHNYQLMLFADTLEHLPDPPALLRRLRDRLEPGGTLVVSLPNVANWAMRLGLLAGRFRYTERGILDRTHLRFYTKRTAAEMLADGGFETIDVTASVPVPLIKSHAMCRTAHVIGNLWPSLFAYNFVITARPAA